MQLTKAELMCSFRGRMQLAAEEAAAEETAKKNSLLSDPWYAPTSRLHGRVDWDGREYITSQSCLDALEIPNARATRRIVSSADKTDARTWLGTYPYQTQRR